MHRKKQIVMIVSNGFNPDPRPFKIGSSLIKKGYSVTVLAWDRDKENQTKEIINGINVFRLGPKSTYGKGMNQSISLIVFWLNTIVYLLKIKFDIIHCHRFDTLLPAFIAGKFRKIPVIYDLHIPFAERLAVHSTKKGIRTLIKLILIMEPFLMKRIFYNITDSPIFTMEIRKKGVKNVTDISNFPEINFSKNFNIVDGERFRPFTIGRIGIMSKQAGSDVKGIIEMFEKLLSENIEVDPYLILIGPIIPENYIDEIKCRIKPYKERVVLKGYIPYSEVPKWYEKMSLSMVQYDLNGKGSFYRLGSQQKVFECMACGVPLILNSNEYMNQLVENVGCGYVIRDNNNSDAFYQSILKVCLNKNIYMKMEKKGREAHLKNLNWEKEEIKLYHIYELANKFRSEK